MERETFLLRIGWGDSNRLGKRGEEFAKGKGCKAERAAREGVNVAKPDEVNCGLTLMHAESKGLQARQMTAQGNVLDGSLKQYQAL